MPDDAKSAQRVRVLHVTSTFPRVAGDPVGTFLVDLLRAQRDAGIDVQVVAPDAPGALGSIDGVVVRRFRASPRLAYRGGLLAAARSPAGLAMVGPYLAAMVGAARAEATRWKPDVVHAHWWFPAGGVAALLGRPYVVTLHGSDVGLAGRPGFHAAATLVARRAKDVVAVSDALATEATGAMGRQVGVAVMPVVVEGDARHEGGGPLLAIGRLSPEKGFDLLVAAASRAGVAVEIVGSGPDEAQLRRAGATILAPMPRAELHARIRRATAVIVPSRREGLGLVALESILIGTPVIATAVGGLPEVMGAYGAVPVAGVPLVVPGGALVAPGDLAGLVAALGRVASLPPPSTTTAERHHPAAVARRHLEIYLAAAGGPAPIAGPGQAGPVA
ncbi:MAG: hypothetical protein NVS3B12_25400 [Acidimicrobiales bacterium]